MKELRIIINWQIREQRLILNKGVNRIENTELNKRGNCVKDKIVRMRLLVDGREKVTKEMQRVMSQGHVNKQFVQLLNFNSYRSIIRLYNMLSVFIKPCLLTLRLLLPRFSFSKQPPHSLTLSTLSTPSSDLHKYSTFTKQSLLHLSTTPLSLTDKILIYSTLKTLHSTTSTHLQTLIISFITYPSLSPPTTPSPSFLGIFLESYSSFSSPCLQYYLNHYSSLSPSPSQELALSRYLSKLPTHKISDPADLWILSQAKQKNKDNLMKLFVTSCLSMGEFIEFMRLFLREVEGRFWEKYLETRYEEPESVEERILLRYMCGLVGIELGEKCRVVLEKVDTKDPKTICMLCELYKTSAETTKQITQNIQFDTTWGYDNIIWISQYLSPSQLLHAHTRLLQTPLPSDPTTLSLYSSRLPPSLHPSLQSYLCSQLSALPSLLHQHTPSDLLYLLSTLPPFPEYALLLAKQCKGGLNWEDTTQLYYYCRLWGLSHEDVDALRIYVVNGYTSMGTARTRIPTSSYYYKLIEIVPAKELFRYKVTFD